MREQPNPSDETATRSVRVWNLGTWALGAIVVAVVLYFLGAFKILFLGVLAAAAVASALRPLADRVPGPRGLAALVVGAGFVLSAAAVLTGIGLLLAGPLKREVSHWPQSRQHVDAALARWGDKLGVDEPVTIDALLARLGSSIHFGQAAGNVADTLFYVAITLAFIFIGSIYLLSERTGELVNPALPILPPARRRQVSAALQDLGPRLRWWLIGVATSMAIVGVVSGIGYSIAGIKFAIPLAVFAAAAELVPTIGPLVGFAAALLVAATQGGAQIAGAAVVWAVVQVLESYVILPLVMKRAVRMPEAVTLFSVVFWGEVLGAAGLFMAIPVNLVIWSFVDHLVIRPRKQLEGKSSGPSLGTPGEGESG